jgi:uncharacterized protein YegL
VYCGVELDPLYIDVIIRRYEAATGAVVILADSGETFEKVEARRRNDENDECDYREWINLLVDGQPESAMRR